MSGTLLLIGEIVVFMVLATAVGFGVGRLTRRGSDDRAAAEAADWRERATLLEGEVEDLTAQLTEARLNAGRGDDGDELAERLAMAEREAAGLERRLREAAERVGELERERDEWIELAEQAEQAAAGGTPPVEGEAVDDDELEALRAELQRRSAQLAQLEEVARQAGKLEGELAAREGRIGDLEAALEAQAASRVAPDGAAAIGVSVGAGNDADSRLTFEVWDADAD